MSPAQILHRFVLLFYLWFCHSVPPPADRSLSGLVCGMNHASEMEKAWRPGPISVDELGPSSKGDINVHAKDFAVGPRLEGGCESCSVSGLWDQGPACPMSVQVKTPTPVSKSLLLLWGPVVLPSFRSLHRPPQISTLEKFPCW